MSAGGKSIGGGKAVAGGLAVGMLEVTLLSSRSSKPGAYKRTGGGGYTGRGYQRNTEQR